MSKEPEVTDFNAVEARVIDVRLVQPKKSDLISVTDAGIVTSVRLTHSAIALAPIFFNELGN